MKKFSPSTNKFYCFSPPVMIATFLFEIFSVVYILWRYKLNLATQIIIAILVNLAIFQYAEYRICDGGDIQWAKIGFVAISFLPPLGIHLASVIAKKNTQYISLIYGLAAMFSLFFLLTSAIESQVCGGNYVIFEYAKSPLALIVYPLYYYSLTLMGMILSFKWARDKNNHKSKTALVSLGAGYAIFLIPTTTVNILAPQTIQAIPSIMCGFAVLLAVALVWKVVPNTTSLRSKR